MKTGLKVSDKAGNVQIQSLKDLQKAWSLAQDYFRKWQLSLAFWKQNVKKLDFCMQYM